MAVHFENDWNAHLDGEFEKPYYQDLRKFLISEYKTRSIHPHMNHIFNALHMTACQDVKAVILGQDPYHGPNQAHGLSFSVKSGVTTPPSLVNIYKELKDDLGCTIPSHGNLEKWTKEGILLLNTVLTVRNGQAHSHRGKGWETFTNRVIDILNDRSQPLVFLLWGRPAQEKAQRITNRRHLILKAPHPSPLSAHRGFFGCHHFSKTNQFLTSTGQSSIDWQIDPLS